MRRGDNKKRAGKGWRHEKTRHEKTLQRLRHEKRLLHERTDEHQNSGSMIGSGDMERYGGMKRCGKGGVWHETLRRGAARMITGVASGLVRAEQAALRNDL